MNSDVILPFIVVGVALPAALTFQAFQSPSWRQMKRWATDANVTITENNDDMIRRRLGRARRYRSLASLPFWWLILLPAFYDRTPPGWAGTLVWVPLTAYTLGSLWAGVSDLGPAEGARSAVLTPRLPSRYVITAARLAPWVLLGMSGLFFVLSRVWPTRLPGSIRTAIPQFVVAVVVAALAELVIRLIAARPQPAMTPSCIDADDALRSTGATAASASALLVSAMTMNTALNAFFMPGHRLWVGAVLMIANMLVAISAFVAIMYQAPWLPRRPRTALDEPGPGTIDA